MNAQTKIRINKTVARKILETVDQGLCGGLGRPEPGQMCVEAAVCYALGLPHGDNPPCVGSAVRAFKIALNDAPWSTRQARASGMRQLAIAQLGSDTLDQTKFACATALATVRKLLPIALRGVADVIPSHAKALEAAAKVCEVAADLAAARSAARSAKSAAWSAAWSAKSAAAESAWSAAAAAESAKSAARDNVLATSATCTLEILVEMKSPGCKYLDLTEPQA